jgi:uracil-DNA glycosylase family 4
MKFSADCRACPRLTRLLDQVRRCHPDYHARPVAPFGARNPQLLVVGLAPGMHGANRTGRPFTGDHAGILLYGTLHRFGFASAPASVHATDGLRLDRCRITNAVKCLPPENKPTPQEIKRCNAYLRDELTALHPGSAVLALGNVAHVAAIMALGLRRTVYPFAHAARHELPEGLTLFDSYHCSRYNTQTRRLTPAMFEAVFADICGYLKSR